MTTEINFHTSDQVLVDGNETTQSQQPPEPFRPKRAKWACQACHKRKVRCDVVNYDTPCTNCRLDIKECVATPRRRQKPRTRSSNCRTDAVEIDHPLAALLADASAIYPEGNTAQPERAPQKRKNNPQGTDSQNCSSQKKQRLNKGLSQCGDNEVAQWMEMMPPSILGQFEDISRHNRGNVDKLNIVQFHSKCSEKLQQAANILTEVIFMHNSISAQLETSRGLQESDGQDTDNHLGDDLNETMQFPPGFCLPDSEKTADTANTLDESVALTPESLDWVTASNYNLFLDLNNFDLDGPLSTAPCDSEASAS
ncbi:hypothetical protein N7457_006180 [Penicillium paradoxum]|uniref:uncharacterized protein n=1 Tax=Penicillium paradoxum TaxID=176176 RepID=UPI00254796A9|nr:uncharacterized protein N7457_006180 [Penicillium paradoxum]KAJ5781020.1 hypothetical protein N7457_006180 [Penicillium paradoxum]